MQLLIILSFFSLSHCFQIQHTPTARTSTTLKAAAASSSASSPFSVKASELEKDLSPEEKTVVSVIRQCGPSVAFVTSVLPIIEDDETTTSSTNSQRRQRSQRRRRPSESNLPRGLSLGSGSAFVVDQDGYLVTNYHVIQQAYEIQQMEHQADSMVDCLVANITSFTGWSSQAVNNTLQQLLRGNNNNNRRRRRQSQRRTPQVYVRISSATKYQPCRIVDVEPDIDVAVLKIMTTNETNTTDNNELAQQVTTPSMTFGSSSDLLVGQNLIAIGNPFGLDNTVTTGVVSALNRELQTVEQRFGMINVARSKPIRNCIQTDCAINPGNSGGPLLNTKGQVVGVNTAIVSTSGSNAGIGFAVPSDQVRPVVESIIRQDRLPTKSQAMLGVSIVKSNGGINSTLCTKNWIASVQRGSPANQAGMRPIVVFEQDASVTYGDAIVAVGGNDVPTFDALQKEIDSRVPGEQVQVTLEDSKGDRRVVYLTLEKQEAPE